MSIEGSKPRKWVKNTHFNNPTMYILFVIYLRHSHNVISLFNPEILRLYDSPAKYYQKNSNVETLPKRSWEHDKPPIRSDSLDLTLKTYNTN